MLFFFQTLSFLIGDGMVVSALQTPDPLADVDGDRVRVAVLLLFVNCAAIIGVGALIFPILRKVREGFALGYAGFRIVESVMLMVSALSPLLLLALSRQADASQLQALGTLVTESYDRSFQMGMIALGIGGLMLCYVLHVGRLVPSIIPVVGFVGYLALITWGWLAIFGVDARSVLFVPGALFEVAFPLWLIVKGFNEPAAAARAS